MILPPLMPNIFVVQFCPNFENEKNLKFGIRSKWYVLLKCWICYCFNLRNCTPHTHKQRTRAKMAKYLQQLLSNIFYSFSTVSKNRNLFPVEHICMRLKLCCLRKHIILNQKWRKRKNRSKCFFFFYWLRICLTIIEYITCLLES